jgi:DNA-binding MarR family transcriptional regulator
MGALTVMLSQAVAERAGVNSTDLEAADLINLMGPMTAGRLAELTGLTTGAITGVIDRLERAGFARRVKDPDDRRRVVIELAPEHVEGKLGPLYEPMQRAMEELYARYSDEEIALLLDFLRRANRAGPEEIARLRGLERGTAERRKKRT